MPIRSQKAQKDAQSHSLALLDQIGLRIAAYEIFVLIPPGNPFEADLIDDILLVYLRVFSMGSRVSLVVNDYHCSIPRDEQSLAVAGRKVVQYVTAVRSRWSTVGLLVLATGLRTPPPLTKHALPRLLQPISRPEAGCLTIIDGGKDRPPGMPRRLHFRDLGTVDAEAISKALREPLHFPHTRR